MVALNYQTTDLPSFDALWQEIAAADHRGNEGETMRSDTTLSVGEWPEELRMGP